MVGFSPLHPHHLFPSNFYAGETVWFACTRAQDIPRARQDAYPNGIVKGSSSRRVADQGTGGSPVANEIFAKVTLSDVA